MNPEKLAIEANMFIEALRYNQRPELASQAANGTRKIIQANHFVRKAVSAGSGTIDLILPADAEEVGVRSIDRARLPKAQPMWVTGIKLLAGVNATLLSSQFSNLLAASTFDAEVNAALANSEIEVWGDGKEQYSTPIIDLMNRANLYTDGTNTAATSVSEVVQMVELDGQGYIQLKRGFLLLDDTLIAIKLKAAAALATNQNVHFGLTGLTLATA